MIEKRFLHTAARIGARLYPTLFPTRLKKAPIALLVGVVFCLGLIPVVAQDIGEVIPRGEARLLILASRGLGNTDDILHRMLTLRMLASDGTQVNINIPENHEVTSSFDDDVFVNWVLAIRTRLRLILQQQGYSIERRTVYRRDNSLDILAVDSITIRPPSGVSILSLSFDINTQDDGLDDSVDGDLYMEYQTFVTPDPEHTAALDWELFAPSKR